MSKEVKECDGSEKTFCVLCSASADQKKQRMHRRMLLSLFCGATKSATDQQHSTVHVQ